MEPCRTGRTSRRTFLQALAVGSLPGILASCTRPRSASRASAPSTPTAELASADLISSPEQALDVFDLPARIVNQNVARVQARKDSFEWIELDHATQVCRKV